MEPLITLFFALGIQKLIACNCGFYGKAPVMCALVHCAAAEGTEYSCTVHFLSCSVQLYVTQRVSELILYVIVTSDMVVAFCGPRLPAASLALI